MSKKKFRQNVAALVRFQDKYLACCRSDYATWQTIQGGIETSDLSPSHALVREMYEELGIQEKDFKIIHQSCVWRRYLFTPQIAHQRHRNNAGQEQLWFLVEVKNPDVLDLQILHEEFSKIEWVTLTELLNRYATWKKWVFYDFCREIGWKPNEF